MTILLQWLIENAWFLYALCAIGAVYYVVRALIAQRDRRLAQFTLERETATARVVQAWTTALLLTVIGAAFFFSATFVLPDLPIHSRTPSPTPGSGAGVELLTPVLTLSPSPTIQMPTMALTATSAPVPTPPPPEPTDTPTPETTDTPEVAVAGEVGVRFGDFAQLAGFSVPTAEVTTAQPLLLTLRWQALGNTSTINYQVFTHLYAEDGRLIGQHDGFPAESTRPMTEWNPGETILDLHPMAFQDTAYTGSARIEVGLWDPATGGRVLTDKGSDRVALPVTISVVGQ
jgi:hypothetical protein